ncbi:aminotransferase class I/II-fold pyridoxal phosphate-dependent enzyme, partial [Campylobacter sp. 50012-21]|uniref:aminotransferase class I/II-fold pyridoxal phosphate-dependent enzyme n=1 Tax=Campylobacter magnus TaxID=3026462 RepID=UPI0023626234
ANKKALIFNSGYSANFAFISCFGGADTLFLADKLVHASMIDALKSANFKRFKHNDANALARLLEQNKDKYKQIIVLCESLYSMDGDYAPLIQFRKLCDSFGALLYVDEAHSFFALNELGECDKQGVRADFML